MRKFEDLTGKKFGKWTVKEYISNHHDINYRCKCDCGFEKIINAGSLRSGATTQCRKCSGESKHSQTNIITKTFFSKIFNASKKRKLDFNITIKYCQDLYNKQKGKCALSGLDIYFGKTSSDINHGAGTASLDRIDSRYGYIIGNVQWVHKDINKMKYNLSQVYFIQMCDLIVKNNIDVTLLDFSKEKYEDKSPNRINARTKISDDDVRKIREEYKNGIKNVVLAEKYNCTPGNISYIVKNQSRRNIC